MRARALACSAVCQADASASDIRQLCVRFPLIKFPLSFPIRGCVHRPSFHFSSNKTSSFGLVVAHWFLAKHSERLAFLSQVRGWGQLADASASVLVGRRDQIFVLVEMSSQNSLSVG